jgi:uncharacterized membrane protein YhaH (DUF805 family)
MPRFTLRDVFVVAMCWIAGFCFWLPSIAVHAIRKDFGRFDVICVTVLSVMVALVALGLLSRRWPDARRSIALWMLLAIWVLGPLCLMLSATVAGNGLARPEGWEIARQITPQTTFILSTYDGTLFALLITTVWLIVAAIIRRTPAAQL